MAEPVRVLHVDDDSALGALTAQLLEAENDRISVITESNPRAALSRLAAERFDCIVSDYAMPEMNGVEFLEAVREDHPELPFILFTGTDPAEVARDALSEGATDYLQKRIGNEQYAILAHRIDAAVSANECKRRLIETTTRYQKLIESVPHIGLAVFDADLRYLLVGGELFSDHGFTTAKARGKRTRELFSDDLDDRVEDRFRAALAGVRDTFELDYEGARYRLHTGPLGTDETGAAASGVVVVHPIDEDADTEELSAGRLLEQWDGR